MIFRKQCVEGQTRWLLEDLSGSSILRPNKCCLVEDHWKQKASVHNELIVLLTWRLGREAHHKTVISQLRSISIREY